MKTTCFAALAALTALLAALPTAGHADPNAPLTGKLSITLDSPLQAALPGSEIVFHGTLQNLTADETLSLDGLAFSFTPPADVFLTGDDGLATGQYFYDPNFQPVLGPQQSYTGDLFGLLVGSSAPVGLSLGSVTFSGTDTLADSTVPSYADSANFQVQAVPETSSALSLGFLLLGSTAAMLTARRRKAAALNR